MAGTKPLARLLVAALLFVPATGQAQLSDRANRNAYDYAVRCFAVAGIAQERGMRRIDNGERAYDMAQQLGARLGYSPQQTDNDLLARSRTETAAMRRDAAYLNRTLDECRRLRLL